MLPPEKVLSSAIQGNTVPGGGSSQEFGDLGGMSNTGWHWAFAVLRIQLSKTHEDAGLGQKGIVFHLPVQTVSSLLVATSASSPPTETHRQERGMRKTAVLQTSR